VAAIRILGIDPGLRRAGWGLITCEGSRLGFLACGTVVVPEKGSLAERLALLHRALVDLVALHAPDEAAVEETYVNANPSSTLKLGQARGVALLAPALSGVPVAEYPAAVVKKTLVGNGQAEKVQVRRMIAVLLPRASPESDDAADALAVAVTHAQHRSSLRVAAGR
jgi:crossover junction endodeoxyribonuclease RuvC